MKIYLDKKHVYVTDNFFENFQDGSSVVFGTFREFAIATFLASRFSKKTNLPFEKLEYYITDDDVKHNNVLLHSDMVAKVTVEWVPRSEAKLREET